MGVRVGPRRKMVARRAARKSTIGKVPPQKEVVEKSNAKKVQAKKERQVQAKAIASDDVETKEDLRSHIEVLKKENEKLKKQCHEYFDDVSKLKLKSKELIVHSDTQMKEGNLKETELQTELKKEKEKVTKLKVDEELLRDENEQLNEKNTDLKNVFGISRKLR